MLRLPLRTIIPIAGGICTVVLGLLAPLPIDPAIQRALGFTFFALIFWSTEPIPIELSSFIFLLLLPLSGLISFEQSFAPFASTTVWLIFAGMVISIAITTTKLGEKLAQYSLQYLGRTPFRLMLNLHLLGLAMAILIPSGVVRILLLMPLGIALADALTSESEDGRFLPTAIQLSLICSTLYGGYGIMTGGVPNLVVAGQFTATTGHDMFWGEWLVWMFPIWGGLRTGLCLLVIWFFWGRHIKHFNPSPSAKAISALDDKQRRVLHILFLGMIFWATDMLHHIPPVYIGLCLVVLYTLPPFGPIPFSNIRQVNYLFLFYIAALFSLATALNASGFNQSFINFVMTLVDIDQFDLPAKYLAITSIAVPLNFLMDVAAVAGVLTPVLLEWGHHYELSEFAIAMSIAQATCHVFLPYQSAPFMVAYSFRRLSLLQLIQAMFLISVLSLILLSPLNILYWSAIGLI